MSGSKPAAAATAASPAAASHTSSFGLSLAQIMARHLDTSDTQHFIERLVNDVVEAAAEDHVQRVNNVVALDYTAAAVWAEMLSLVKCSVVPHDHGYRSVAEIAASEGSRTIASDHHDPWRPDVPPLRVITEEHSRRVVDIRPAALKPDSPSMAQGGRRRRGEPQISRPVSGSIEEANVRALLGGRNSIVKPGSRGSVDAAHITVRPPSSSSIPSTTARFGTTHRVKAKSSHHGSGRSNDHSHSPNSAISIDLATEETLQQPDVATDEAEIQQHQETMARMVQERDDAIKRTTRISKALADPKNVPKNFTIDGSGNVIAVSNVDESRAAAMAEAATVKFQIPNPAPPQPVVIEAPPTGKQRNANRSGIAPAGGTGDGDGTATSKSKKPSREAKKDDVYVTADARDVPMHIKVAPAGGVLIKDQQGPPRTSELKLPSSKMSRTEFQRLRGIFAGPDVASVPLSEMLTSAGHDLLASSTLLSSPRGTASEVLATSSATTPAPQLPVKRNLAPLGKKSDPNAAKDAPSAETARKPPTGKSALASTAPASARSVTSQAPAPPPKRDGQPAPLASRKVVIGTKPGLTPQNDPRRIAMADSWRSQQETNQLRDTERVVVGQGWAVGNAEFLDME